jgi:hypothetical protein
MIREASLQRSNNIRATRCVSVVVKKGLGGQLSDFRNHKLTQCIILPSRAPDMKPEPSGSHASAVTVSVCSVRVSIHTPVYTYVFESKSGLSHEDKELTFTFHILIRCSALVSNIESSSDHAKHPTTSGWSRNIRCVDQSSVERPVSVESC